MPAVAQMEDASLHFSRYTVRFPMRAGFGGLSTWWQQEIGSGHSTWALTVHVRHPMCVRCKEFVCPCTPVLWISVKANDHPPPITSHKYRHGSHWRHNNMHAGPLLTAPAQGYKIVDIHWLAADDVLLCHAALPVAPLPVPTCSSPSLVRSMARQAHPSTQPSS
jgi:hypothetical protein